MKRLHIKSFENFVNIVPEVTKAEIVLLGERVEWHFEMVAGNQNGIRKLLKHRCLGFTVDSSNPIELGYGGAAWPSPEG